MSNGVKPPSRSEEHHAGKHEEPSLGSTAIVLLNHESIGPDMGWPLRITTRGECRVSVIICVPRNIAEKPIDIDLSARESLSGFSRSVAEKLVPVLDEYLGPGRWEPDQAPPERATDGEEEPEDTAAFSGAQEAGPWPVRVLILPQEDMLEALRKSTPNPKRDLAIFLAGPNYARDREWMKPVRSALRSTDCSTLVIGPGKRPEGGELLVASGRGSHGRKAIELAGQVSAATERKLTALYVEPDIGPDSREVGHVILEGLLKSSLHEQELDKVERRVELSNDPVAGITHCLDEGTAEVLFMGASRLGALGTVVSTSVPNKILRSNPDATLILVRHPTPIRWRLLRWTESQALRLVPQLVREERIDLVERVQSNSQWNFDFILLIALSTFIASLGLLDNSAAVIIGAMLVAPLMTPLIGLGLSIAQGNSLLARITLKSCLLGFLTAFLLAFFIGLLPGNIREATPEMESRDWPQNLDLVVAFVSGLAAAYASARSSLLAALPGVAIAAALLPPIATSGLALSIGDVNLAIGSLLLFAVNAVAITVAAAISLWAVGVRDIGRATGLPGLIGKALTTITVVAALAFTLTPPLLDAPHEMVRDVRELLGEDYRLRGIHLYSRRREEVVQVDVGGDRPPSSVLQKDLLEIAREHLGKNADVRLTYRFEVTIE